MAHEHPPASNGAPYNSNFAVVHYSRTYDEAFTLLVEARNYLAAHRSSRQAKDAPDRLIAQCVEEMRMTTRLIRAMSWLLAVRAVEEGEIDWQEAVDVNDLMVDLKVCIDDCREKCPNLPPGLSRLMDRAHSLYMRAARMELQAAARSNRAGPGNGPCTL